MVYVVNFCLLILKFFVVLNVFIVGVDEVDVFVNLFFDCILKFEVVCCEWVIFNY